MNRNIITFVFLLISVYCCIAANNCWWSGCQPNTWAQRGCSEGYYQVNTQPCSDNGDMYQCCPNGVPNSLPVGPEAQTSPLPSGRVAESGKCSWYGAEGEIPQGWPTASGEGFDRFAMRAAHKTLPFGTGIRVTNVNNGKTVDVMVNDRGPYCPAGVSCPPFEIKIVDLAYGAMQQIAELEAGVIPCSYEIL